MKDIDKNNENEIRSNSIEYLEEETTNASYNKNENNNIFSDSVNEIKNKFPNENLKSVAIDNSNNISINEFVIPLELKKTFRLTIALTITGFILILFGILKAIIIKKVLGGIFFWILASLVLIPGGFYSYQFYKAKTAQKEYERQEILDSIPKI